MTISSLRYDDLKNILESRTDEVRAWIGSESAQDKRSSTRDEIELALVQIAAETLGKLADAKARLERSEYGFCSTCGEEIAAGRLKSLPFAARCKSCEEAKDVAEMQERQRQRAARRDVHGLFDDL